MTTDTVPLAFVEVWRLSPSGLIVRERTFIDQLSQTPKGLGAVRITLRTAPSRGLQISRSLPFTIKLAPHATAEDSVVGAVTLTGGLATSKGAGVRYTVTTRLGRSASSAALTTATAWRCDDRDRDQSGCVAPRIPATLGIDANAVQALDPVAYQVAAAQAAGLPGSPTGSPLHAVSAASAASHKKSDCAGLSADGQFTSCSVYPLADSQEATGPARPSVHAVDQAATSAESAAVAAFVTASHTLPGDPYFVAPEVRVDQTGPRIMVVGDSISEGFQGTATWRYRLWQELTTAGVDARFVGPWTGTYHVMPLSQVTVVSHDGGYRAGAAFNSANDAKWGGAMSAVDDSIQATVAADRPTVLLVELGFNDLAFEAQSPSGLLSELATLVAKAREAQPDLTILVGDVVHAGLTETTSATQGEITTYDDDLPAETASLTTATSPVYAVDLDSTYQVPRDTWDGVHPNSFGEYALAQSFATALSDDTGIGTAIPANAISSSLYVPALSPPTGLVATSPYPGVVSLTWRNAFDASQYKFDVADVTKHQHLTLAAGVSYADGFSFDGLTSGDTYKLAVVSEWGPSSSARSTPVRVTVR